jgi:folate-binding protein YgfZ
VTTRAWVPFPDDRVVEVTGADATGFLHRMLTQDVKGIPVGDGRPALLLTPRGRVIGDPFVVSRPGGHLLVLSKAAAEATLPALERYVIADDVVFRDVSGAFTTGLLLGDVPVPPGALAPACPFGAEGARRLLVGREGAAGAERTFGAAGAVELEGAAFHARRVDAGAPWFGAEFDDRILPNEARLDAWISFTKGCYVGQEPVIMAKHRGHPPTLLVRLAIADGPAPERDTPLLDGGRPAGRVTTAYRVGIGAGVRALGFVRYDLAVAGRAFALADGRAAGAVG